MDQKNKQLMVFLAGELQDQTALEALIAKDDFDFYAADGGYRIAEQMNIPLERVIGDFDSIEKPDHPNVRVFPCEKDQTDSEISLEMAIEEGYKTIWFIAPFGGRIDHTIANFHLMNYAMERGVSLNLFDGKNLAFALPEGEHKIAGDYRYVSFIPVEKSAEISLSDFKYPLERRVIFQNNSLGISNEPLGPAPKLQVHRGAVYCICIL